MRVTSGSTGWIGVEPLHDHVADYELQILGDLHILDSEMDRHIGDLFADPAAEAEHCIRLDAHRLRLLEEWLIEMTPESLKKEAVHEALARVVTEVDLACSAIGEELLGGGPAPGALEGTQSMRAG